jgi:ubiquitin
MAKKKTEDKAPEESTSPDLAVEFAELGRAMRDALSAAWNSEERQKFQGEIRTGMSKLADEMETAAKRIRDTETAQQVESKAKQVRDDVQSGKVTDDARGAVAQALRSTRDAMDRMADSFTPHEGDPVEFEPLDMDRAKKKKKDEDK